MFQRIRRPEPFGKAGLTVAILALVFAMLGGAYAAGALSGKQKKEVEKIAKKFAGKPGAPGTPGAAGPAGKDGSNGSNGANGTSVTNTPLAKGSVPCPEGGAEFKVGSGAATKACNGTTGFTETLPEGKTETGAWSTPFIEGTEQAQVLTTPISFAIPLEAPLDESHVHYLTSAEQTSGGTTECPGSVETPLAAKGNLCVYQGGTLLPGPNLALEEEFRVVKIFPVSEVTSGEAGASSSGAAALVLYIGEAEKAFMQGSWAVTG